MKLRHLFPFLLLINGCMTRSPTYISSTNPNGATAKELKNAAEEHTTQLNTISKEAHVIYAKATTPEIQAASKTIIDASSQITYVSDILKNESGRKDNYEQLAKAYDDLQRKTDSGENRLMLLLRIIGVICIPVGIILAKFLFRDCLVISIGGAILLIAAQVDKFVARYGEWFIGLMVLIILGVAIRMYFVHRKTLFSSVSVSETLKTLLAKVDPDSIKQLFGEGTIPGLISQDPTTEAQIKAARLAVLKKAKPLAEVV